MAVLWLWTLVLSASAVSLVFLRIRWGLSVLVIGTVVAAAVTFSPGVRRLVFRLWRTLGGTVHHDDDERDDAVRDARTQQEVDRG